MAQPYPTELRIQIIEAVEREGLTHEAAARRFKVGASFVSAVMRRFREKGAANSPHARSGPSLRLDKEAVSRIRRWLRCDPGLSLSQLGARLKAQGLFVHRCTVSRALKRMGWSRPQGVRRPQPLSRRAEGKAHRRTTREPQAPTKELSAPQGGTPAGRAARMVWSERLVSPLRYPGGKNRLVPYVQELLSRNGLRPSLFVEPFAGGASVAIGVLQLDLADRIALADRDELLADFWATVFSEDARWLADQCLTVKVNLKTWRTMRALVPATRRERALKCLYLNRTSFSGIIEPRAGPLGGYSQEITDIACRFPREELARRILALSQKRDRVAFVRTQSYARTFADVRGRTLASARPQDLFWYLDPPFFRKAEKLYSYCFSPADHAALARRLETLPGNWLLSYDDDPEARRLYGHRQGLQLAEMIYSSRRSDNDMANRRLYAGREILVSNLEIPGVEAATKRSRLIRLAVLDGSSGRPAPNDSIERSSDPCKLSSRPLPPPIPSYISSVATSAR